MSTFKELLAQKITSSEQFSELVITAHRDNREYMPGPFSGRSDFPSLEYLTQSDGRGIVNQIYPNFRSFNGMSCSITKSRWWLAREWLRIRYGAYEMTNPLVILSNQFPELAVHCARTGDDPTLVAYTPDHEKGERDTQVQISLGRLMRKLYPQLADDVIASVEADHRAALSDEIELIPWGKEFLKAYGEAQPACMSKTVGAYGGGYHPTEAYDVPWLKLAVIRNSKGAASARCLTYINPDNPDDKRWIRIYGDAMIQRRLEKHGYRCAGLDGVRLKKIHAKGGDADVFVVPYLDAPAHNPKGEMLGQFLVHDGEYLRVVNEAQAKTFVRVTGYSAPGGCTTSGVVRVPLDVNLEALWVTCHFSNVKFEPSTQLHAKVRIDGKDLWVCAAEMPRIQGWKQVYDLDKNEYLQRYLMPPETEVFGDFDDFYLETEKVRKYLGYHRMAPKHYGENVWVGTSSDIVQGSDGDYLKFADAVDFITPEAEVRLVHKNDVDLSTAVKVTRLHSARPTYVAKGVEVVKTVGGKRVVSGVHPVVKLFDGRVEYLSKATAIRVGSVTLYGLAGDTIDTLPMERVMEALLPPYLTRAKNTAIEHLPGDDDREPMQRFEYNLLRVFARFAIFRPAMANDGRGVITKETPVGYKYVNCQADWRDACVASARLLADPTLMGDYNDRCGLLRRCSLVLAMEREVCAVFKQYDVVYPRPEAPPETVTETPVRAPQFVVAA